MLNRKPKHCTRIFKLLLIYSNVGQIISVQADEQTTKQSYLLKASHFVIYSSFCDLAFLIHIS